MADYENFVGGSLKLKSKSGVKDGKIKKKKKKKKNKNHKKDLERAVKHSIDSGSSDNEEKRLDDELEDNRTKAEIAFDKYREKKQEERLLEKASKTHKERIMDFNSHLDSLTEHFDIPKVSWTK